MIKPFTEVTPQKPPDLCAKHRFFMSDIRFAILCVFWYNENSLRRACVKWIKKQRWK